MKPSLLLPLAVVIALLLPGKEARRLAAGFAAGTAAGLALTVLAIGTRSLGAWAGALLEYAGSEDWRQPWLTSVSGLDFTFLRRPWTGVGELGTVALWIALACALIALARKRGWTLQDDEGWWVLSVAIVGWMLLTPYVHPWDLVLELVALPIVLGARWQSMADPLVLIALAALLTLPDLDLLVVRPSYSFSWSVFASAAILLALRPWHLWRGSVRSTS